MSTGPMNPYPTPQFGAPPGGNSPELRSKASSAFTMGIASIILGLPCCCPLIGLVLGILAMNNAGSVLATAAAGSEPFSKASSAKTMGIVGIVISIIGMIVNVIGVVIQLSMQQAMQ